MIIPYLSSDSPTTANIPIFFALALSVVLQVFLCVYKRLKFRKQIEYEQQLRQVMMTGVRNAYGKIIIFTEILGFFLLDTIHVYLVKNIEGENEYRVGQCFILALVLFFILLNHFIFNHKLRFSSVTLDY